MEKPKRFEQRELYRRFRYRMIRKAGCRCELCGARKPLKLVYVKEIAIFPELALAPENAKVICYRCLSDEWPGGSTGGYKSFYDRPEWKHARERVIANLGITCRHCHRTPDVPSDVHVDHIEPKFIFPEKALILGNLQPLCVDCNIGKGAAVFENTLASSYVNQYLERIRARAKAADTRYLNGLRRHISNGPEIDRLIKYADFRYAVKEAYGYPNKLESVLASAAAEIRQLETPAGETFDLFTVAV